MYMEGEGEGEVEGGGGGGKCQEYYINCKNNVHITTGTDDATRPTSSSSCMIFFILAYSVYING